MGNSSIRKALESTLSSVKGVAPAQKKKLTTSQTNWHETQTIQHRHLTRKQWAVRNIKRSITPTWEAHCERYLQISQSLLQCVLEWARFRNTSLGNAFPEGSQSLGSRCIPSNKQPRKFLPNLFLSNCVFRLRQVLMHKFWKCKMIWDFGIVQGFKTALLRIVRERLHSNDTARTLTLTGQFPFWFSWRTAESCPIFSMILFQCFLCWNVSWHPRKLAW